MKSDLQPNWKWASAGVLIALLYGVIVLTDHRLPWLIAESGLSAGASSLHQRVGVDVKSSQDAKPLPTGKGVTAGHVEGKMGDYLPNTQDSEFAGMRMIPRSGDSKINGHAEFTSRVIYGSNGLAPGIQDVFFYTSSHWLTRAVIKAGTGKPPDPDGRRVFSHSWIGIGRINATDILRRVDYLVDHHDVIMAVGVNNGEKTQVPALLGSAYNVIAVGLDTGKSSGGYTQYEGRGRCKPDIVAPRGVTSYSTPVVAGIAARLLETADGMAHAPYAGRSELIKAVLLAGAKKPKGWNQEPGKPLDSHLGAGLVQFDRSYSIMTAGPMEKGQTSTANDGWDFQAMPPQGNTHTIGLQLEHPSELSVVLVWNRRIDGRVVEDLLSSKKQWLNTPRVANFDLALVRVSEQGVSRHIARSASTIDNIEHVYKQNMPSGIYQLEVSRKDTHDEDWEYALAWRITPLRPHGSVTKRKKNDSATRQAMLIGTTTPGTEKNKN